MEIIDNITFLLGEDSNQTISAGVPNDLERIARGTNPLC